MTDSIKLRPATEADYAFAAGLYLRTMRPYTEELMLWDEQKQIASFARQWRVEDVQVIWWRRGPILSSHNYKLTPWTC